MEQIIAYQRFQFEDDLEKGYTHTLVAEDREHIVKVNPLTHLNNADWKHREVGIVIPVENMEKRFEELKVRKLTDYKLTDEQMAEALAELYVMEMKGKRKQNARKNTTNNNTRK